MAAERKPSFPQFDTASSVFYDCRSRADTESFADCWSNYPESMVSDDQFYDADLASTPGGSQSQLNQSGILSWPNAETDDTDEPQFHSYPDDMDII